MRQCAERHLLGFDQQHVHQLVGGVHVPVACRLLLDDDALFGDFAALHVLQLPCLVAHHGFFGVDGFGQFELRCVMPDRNVQQGFVGQHGADIDHAVGLFDPHTVAGAGKLTRTRGGLHIVGIAA